MVSEQGGQEAAPTSGALLFFFFFFYDHRNTADTSEGECGQRFTCKFLILGYGAADHMTRSQPAVVNLAWLRPCCDTLAPGQGRLEGHFVSGRPGV